VIYGHENETENLNAQAIFKDEETRAPRDISREQEAV